MSADQTELRPMSTLMGHLITLLVSTNENSRVIAANEISSFALGAVGVRAQAQQLAAEVETLRGVLLVRDTAIQEIQATVKSLEGRLACATALLDGKNEPVVVASTTDPLAA